MPASEIPHSPLRLAVLISGSGTTLRNILDRIESGRLSGIEVVGVIASRDCPGLEHARHYGIPHAVITRLPTDSPAGQPFDVAEFSERVTEQLDEWGSQLIACAGFLSPYLAAPQYAWKVLNVHPALLPAFGGPGMYGRKVHEEVLASGAKVSGCTVHLVDEDYDSGPIIAQRTVAVMDGDTPETLALRVQAAERELYPLVLQAYADGRIHADAYGTLTIDPRVLIAE